MNKDELINGIKTLAASGQLERNEVIAAYEQGKGLVPQQQTESSSTLSRYSGILYYIGGGIIFLGLIFFIGELWSGFNTFMRIFITLGTGIAAYMVGVLFNQQHRLGSAGPAFFMISALLIPGGILVGLDEFNIRVDEDKIQNLISGSLFVTYLASYILFKRFVLIIFSILFGTWFYFAVAGTLLSNAILLPEIRFGYYLFTSLGLSYLFIGMSYENTDKQALVKILYLFGINFFLGSLLALTGWKPAQDVLWELLYPGLVFAGLYVSAIIHSRIILGFCAFYLALYIIKITVEYFSDGLGWPITLILCGFILMGMGYTAIHLKRKYNI
jgi:hypothetical protein